MKQNKPMKMKNLIQLGYAPFNKRFFRIHIRSIQIV